MGQYFLKLVPDDEPNADGFWISAEMPTLEGAYDLAPIVGHHVVSAVTRWPDRDPQGHYVFDASWLPTNLKGH